MRAVVIAAHYLGEKFSVLDGVGSFSLLLVKYYKKVNLCSN